MKTLLIVRHAKSSWDSDTVSDFDRTLNERGKKDAPMMGARLLERNIAIDEFVASPAKRARKTAELFIEAMNEDSGKLRFEETLYHAPRDLFYEVISRFYDDSECVAIFSHNPGITDFVNSLTSTFRTDNMPTAGVAAVTAAIDHWKDFADASKTFLFFDYPKL
ncbi:MAG: histidine phosphatase family protein [Gemmatimonadaceae bacterium]|nr:histidine phosphatase family protein [Chitinophagaceae bacterium]